MTSKEIIIKLIDRNLINGEEAFVLINDLPKPYYGYPNISWNKYSTNNDNIVTATYSELLNNN